MHAKTLLIGLSAVLLILVGWGILLLTRTNYMALDQKQFEAAIPAIDRTQPAVTETATFGLG